MSKDQLLEKITLARGEINIVEGELDDALRIMQTSSGNEKVAISQMLEDAFTKLKSAKASLNKLEIMLANEE